MSIVKMKRLRLVGMRTDQEELLKVLQRLGCVEIARPEVDEADPVWAGLSHPDSAALNEARDAVAALSAALTTLNQYAPSKGGMFKVRPTVDEKTLFDDDAYAAALTAAETINRAQRSIQSLLAEQTKLRTQKATLVPWLPLEIPLDTQSTDEVEVQFGSVPVRADWAQFDTALRQAAPLAQLIPAATTTEAHYLLFLCHRSAADAAGEVLKEFSFSSAPLKGWQGTAAENDKALDAELARVAQELAAEEKNILSFADRRGELERAVDRAEQEIGRQETKGLLLDTEAAFYLDGWVPAEEEVKLAAATAPFACAWETSDPTDEDIPEVPVKLKNNWLTRPLNMVTEMYSLPAYNGVDPNPLMAPFFILFYGIMMADMGYGLLMMLGGLFISRKFRPRGTMGHMFNLATLCGISTFIMGVITGGFFGDLPTQVAKILFDTDFALPALFTPLNDTLMILIGSMALGAVHIITGMAVSFVRKIKAGDIMDAIWEEVTWWVVFAGLALMVLGVTPIPLAVGGIMIVVGSGWNAKGFGKVTAIFGSLYNHITGFFGDILSYSRLMALMLAGSVIAQVFNTLGAIPGNIVIFLIISLAGNALNFALNLLGCYVHDLRLQCLEYFGKFYQDGGKPFKPLAFNTKYVDIVNHKEI